MSDAQLNRTPALQRLIQRLHRRLVVAVWLHGLGVALACASLFLAFAFVADYALGVPGPIRVALGLGVVVVLVAFLIRDLARPLRRIPPAAGLAVLLERPHPELNQLLVSAVELQAGEADDMVSQDLIRHVIAEAEARAGQLSLADVLHESGPRLRFLGGTLAVGLLALSALTRPDLASIFLNRMLGRSTPWPQLTHLVLQIPLAPDAARIEREDGLLRVRVARGTDVPVLVRAEGEIPSEVLLHFDQGRDRVLSPSGGGVFRTMLRSPQESLAFHATGGDDRDGEPRVEIEILQPPDVERVAVEVEPPAWSGLAPMVSFNRDVEVVAGSKLRIHALTSPRGATGEVRLLPEDLLLDLTRTPFPRDDDDDLTPEHGLSFQITATTSFAYRFEVVDETGLANPDPGLFRVSVLGDRVPELRVLAPGRSEFDTVLGGMIPIRLWAEDDFGLTSMGWEIHAQGRDREQAPAALLQAAFEPPHRRARSGLNGARAWLGDARIEVESLAPPEGELRVDQRFELTFTAADNHQPEPGVGRSASVRLRLISADELLRRMQDRLARARLNANRLVELQREKQRRVGELVDALDPAESLATGDILAINAAAVGQRRVQNDASTLARDLASVAQELIYARLDDKSSGLLEFLDVRLAQVEDTAFHSELWIELTDAFEGGELGAPGFTGNLVSLVDQALSVSAEAALLAAQDIDRAQQATNGEARLNALFAAYENQTVSVHRIEALLESLAEWDNFQNVLALTRDILNRQKALRDRTRRFAKENE